MQSRVNSEHLAAVLVLPAFLLYHLLTSPPAQLECSLSQNVSTCGASRRLLPNTPPGSLKHTTRPGGQGKLLHTLFITQHSAYTLCEFGWTTSTSTNVCDHTHPPTFPHTTFFPLALQPSLQRVADAAQRLLLRPSLTAGVAALFRPVLLPLASALVDARLAGVGHAAHPGACPRSTSMAPHATVAVALVTLTELAPHLSGCAAPEYPPVAHHVTPAGSM